jgi:hypothetical protein
MHVPKLKHTFFHYGAPIILIVIAIFQHYLVHTQNLTPWKGGGFGMFSTTDSQGARFLRIIITTELGSFPAKIPDYMRDFARKTRALPTEERIEYLASQLAQVTWVQNIELSGIQSSYEMSGQTTSTSLTHSNSDENVVGPTSNFPSDEESSLAFLGNETQPAIRALELGEPVLSNENVIEVFRVRVELWRFNFDLRTGQVNAYRFLESTAESTGETK